MLVVVVAVMVGVVVGTGGRHVDQRLPTGAAHILRTYPGPSHRSPPARLPKEARGHGEDVPRVHRAVKVPFHTALPPARIPCRVHGVAPLARPPRRDCLRTWVVYVLLCVKTGRRSVRAAWFTPVTVACAIPLLAMRLC